MHKAAAIIFTKWSLEENVNSVQSFLKIVRIRVELSSISSEIWSITGSLQHPTRLCLFSPFPPSLICICLSCILLTASLSSSTMASCLAYSSLLIINDISFLPSPPLREDAGLWRFKSLLEEKQTRKQLFLLTFPSTEEESCSPPGGIGSRTNVHSYTALTHIQTHTHGHKPLSHTPRRGGLALKQEHTAGCRLPGKAWCVPPSRHTQPSQRLFVGADSSPALWLSTGVCSHRHGAKQGQSHEKERQHPGEGNITK